MDGNKQEYTMAVLATDMGWVKKQLSNHLAHHNKYLYMLVSGQLALIGALIVALLT